MHPAIIPGRLVRSVCSAIAAVCLLAPMGEGIVTSARAGVPRARPARPRTIPSLVSARLSARVVSVHDYLEVTLLVGRPIRGNPFTDVEVTGTLAEAGRPPVTVHGFCDSDDGSVFRIRFMPRSVGVHRFTVRYSVPAQGVQWSHSQTFRALPSSRKGLVQVDSDHPFHFIWSGTGEHFFPTGATAYHLLSWTDPAQMMAHFNRMVDAGANRIRLLNYGRASDDEWSEGMVQSSAFIWTLTPWLATYPSIQLEEGTIEPDHTRFNLAHWRKAESLLRAMRDRDVVAAINLYMDRGIVRSYGPDDSPPAGSEDEALYFRYAVARYGAFSNVVWDLGTEHDEYRTPEWANAAGTLIKEWDPYAHLVSAHPNQFRPEYLTEPWYDFAEYQYYGVDADSFGGNVLERVNGHIRFWRDRVRSNGRVIPQVNEEYGFELDPDGYDEPIPQIRRKAWAIVMGGGYLTSGEHKAWQHGDPTNGGQVAVDTQILSYTRIMRQFFEGKGIPYWRMEPMSELDGSGAFGLAEPGQHYAVYLPYGGTTEVTLPQGRFSASWYRPTEGTSLSIGTVSGGVWRSPAAPAPPSNRPDDSDVVLYLRRQS